MSDSVPLSIGDLVSTDALEFGDGYRTKRSEHGRSGYRIIRVADVSENAISFGGHDFVSTAYGRAIGSKIGQSGDIILTTKGTVGRVAVMPETHEPVVYSPQLCYFRVLNSQVISPRFLRFWFSSPEFWSQAADRMNNTDMAAYINMADVRSLKISLPNIQKQQAVAEVLGALDDKIAANTKLAETATALVQAEFQAVMRAADQEATIGQILTLEYGKSLAATKRVPGSVDVFGSGGIVGKHDTALLPGPGVIVGRKGTAGAVHWSSGPFFPIDTTYFAVPLTTDISQLFIYFLLLSARLDEMNSDSAVPGLNRNEAHATKIKLPSSANLAAFTSLMDPVFQIASQCERENMALTATRDALLPQLMSGKLRVKDVESLVSAAV